MREILLPAVAWSSVAGAALIGARRALARARVAPLTARAHDLGGSSLPVPFRWAVDRWWGSADLAVSPEQWLRTTALFVALVSPVAGVVALWLVPVAALGTLGARVGQVAQRVRSCQLRRTRLAPGLIESMAAELRSGASLQHAFAAQRATKVPGHELLAPLLDRLALGAAIPEALDAWDAAGPLPEVQSLVAVFRVAAERGGHLAPVLEQLASSIRDRHHVRDELHLHTSQARLSAFIVASAPVGFLVFTLLTDRRAAAALVMTTVGRWCLVLGALCNVAAVVVIVWILRDPAARRPRRTVTRERHRQLLFEREVPACADLIAVLFGAGATPLEAVAGVADWGPPLSAPEFRSTVDRVFLGSSPAQALGRLADHNPALAPVSRAVLAATHGAPVGALIVRLGDDARQALRREGELRARRIPVLLLFPLVFMVLPAFMLLSVVPALLAGFAAL